MAFKKYWYQNQIRNYMLQFVDVFTGLRVRTGSRANGQSIFLTVPVRYASQDRLANMLSQSQGYSDPDQHDAISASVPIMSAYMAGISLRTEALRHPGIVDRNSYITVEDEEESTSDTDRSSRIKVKARPMPTPYLLTMNLHIIASNTDQHLQILEQLMMIFNPDITIQTNDSIWDAAALTTIKLTDIGLDTEIPIGTETRFVGSTLTFEVPIWISGPMIEISNGHVNAVRANIRDASEFDGSLDDLDTSAISGGVTSTGIDIDMFGQPVDVNTDEFGETSGHIIPE